MYVLVDLEWVAGENGENYLTQMYAERVTSDWRCTEAFDLLICPPNDELFTVNALPFSGYSADEFKTGVTEERGFSEFSRWLCPDDELLFWHYTSESRFFHLWRQWCGEKPRPKSHNLYSHIFALLGVSSGNAYTLCCDREIEVQAPEHCSKNDVAAAKALLTDIGITWE